MRAKVHGHCSAKVHHVDHRDHYDVDVDHQAYYHADVDHHVHHDVDVDHHVYHDVDVDHQIHHADYHPKFLTIRI